MTRLERSDSEALHALAHKARSENTPKSCEIAALMSAAAEAVWSYTKDNEGYSPRELAVLREVVGRKRP